MPKMIFYGGGGLFPIRMPPQPYNTMRFDVGYGDSGWNVLFLSRRIFSFSTAVNNGKFNNYWIFNAEKTLALVLEKLVYTLPENSKIIVVDDCSTDNSSVIQKNFQSGLCSRKRTEDHLQPEIRVQGWRKERI